MVMKMNKTGFINELVKELNCDENYARLVIDIYEENFIVGKKNKEKTINNFKEKLELTEEKANEIYNTCSKIVTTEIKNKIKHPFKSKD